MQHDFRYVSKKDPRLRRVFADAVQLIRETQDAVRGQFTFQYRVRGSYSRNMVTYDAKSNTGYDLDFDLIIHDTEETCTPEKIKKILQKAMGKIARQHGYDFPEDSTRVLTLKCKDRENARILHSIDFAVIREYADEEGGTRRECIRYDKKRNRYFWNEQPSGESDLPEKIQRLKAGGQWNELRAYYLDKKNRNEDQRLHSRQLFAMAVNEMLQRSGLAEAAEDEKAADTGRGVCRLGRLPYNAMAISLR